MSTAVILNGDQVYMEELVRENARLMIQVEAERRHRRELEATITRLKQENETLADHVEQAEEDLKLSADGLVREEGLAAKLDQAIKDLHFVMAGGDACTVCKNKCPMGKADDCKPCWKILDD